jgi:Capsule assembly protein Wzi
VSAGILLHYWTDCKELAFMDLLGSRQYRFAIRCLVLLIIVGCLAGPVHASVNLPLHHWAYEAIERLTVLGIIDEALLTPKPYGRKEAAKIVSRAIERIRAGKIDADGRAAIAEPLLNRLMVEFRDELIAVGTLKRRNGDSSGLFRFGARLQTEVDQFFVGDGQTVRLRENRGGEYYANGLQNQTDLRGWMEVGDWAAFMLQPKVITNADALSRGPTVGPLTAFNDEHAYLREGTAKFTWWNIAVEVGRGTQWWGPGYHGSLLLTDHAFPLDMIKLGSDEAFRLPWKFGQLGQWKINSFLGRLEGPQTFPHEDLFGLRVSYLPVAWLELGLTRVSQFGGQGSGTSFPRTLGNCYKDQPNQGGAANCNEQAMVDVRTQVPHIPYLIPFPAGLQVYGELGSEDKWSKFPIPSRGAFLAGIYIPQMFPGDTTDLRIEYADTDLARRQTGMAGIWYNNGFYTNGMRQYGFPLGHHMGTDGIDFFVRSTRSLLEDLQLGSNFDYQERGRGQSVFERKQEMSADLTWWMTPTTQFTFAYVYQRIKNPGQISSMTPFVETFTPNVTATNHLFSVSLIKEF